MRLGVPMACARPKRRCRTADGFRSVKGTASWHDMARFCQERRGHLRNEADFVDDMTGWTLWREPTEKQAKWLCSIYARLGGGP
jgi:hypothetical protein